MLNSTKRAGLTAGLLSFSFIAALAPALADDETREIWRLFVTDQAEAKVTLIDPAKGAAVDVFPTKGYVTHLVPTDSGETLFAVQMDHDMVNVIKSGVTLSGHGDHSDIKIEDPALLPLKLEGGRPVHAVMHGDEIVQFFDREGEGRVYSEAALLKGDSAYKSVKTAAPHHGVVVPMDDYFVVSEPNLQVETKKDALPPRFGAKVVDEDSQPVTEAATCTGLHGEAKSAGLLAFGCEEGVLIARSKGGKPAQLEMLPYTDDMPKGRVGHLAGGKAMQFFLGDYGHDKLVVIDPESQSPYMVVELPVRHLNFALDPARVKTAYVFTEDGRLHALNVLSGEISRSKQITEAYSKDGHWRDPRPRIAVMGDAIAVTDPREGLIRLVDAESFKELKTIKVDGAPFNVTAVGGSGLQH